MTDGWRLRLLRDTAGWDAGWRVRAKPFTPHGGCGGNADQLPLSHR